MHSGSQSGLLKNAAVMSVAVFLSRILGLVREQVFAFFFGAGIFADAYLVAFRIPNLLRDLFAEGALSSAFVAVFSKQKTPEKQFELYKNIKIVMGTVLFFVTLLLFFGAPLWVNILAPSFAHESDKFFSTLTLTRLFAPFLFFASMAALAMGVLNTLGKFFIPSLGSAAFNLGSIVVGGGLALVLRGFGDFAMVVGFGVGTLIGGYLQWAIQWPSLRNSGVSPLGGFKGLLNFEAQKSAWRDSELRRVFRIMAPSVLSVAAVQINVLINTLFATGLGTGAVAYLNYAFRILHFPMGIFGVSLSTATLPRLSALRANGEMKDFETTLTSSQTASLFLALGSSVGIWVFAEPLCALFFEYGKFSRQDTLLTAQVLSAYAVGLFAFNGTKIFIQAFYALEAVWIPSVLSAVAIGLNYFFNDYFAPKFGPPALAGVTAGVAVFNFFSLGLLLARFGLFPLRFSFWRSFVVSLVCALSMMGFRFWGYTDSLLNIRDGVVSFGGLSPKFGFAVATLGMVFLAGVQYLTLVGIFEPQARIFVKNKMLKRFQKKP